ncbi:MAG: DUF1192 domain-containing protein [Alphaproteobacteria bacterium]
MFDDLEPRKKFTGTELGQNLERFSIQELDFYVAALHEEIERVQTDKDKKISSQAAADSFFKS